MVEQGGHRCLRMGNGARRGHPARRPLRRMSRTDCGSRRGVADQLADGSRRTLRPGLAATSGGAGVEAGAVGRQAAAGGPGPQPLDRLAGRHGDRDDVLRRLDQRDVEQRRQPAARLDLGAASSRGPGGRGWPGSRPYLSRYIRQIACFSAGPGQVEEERGVEPLGRGELRREPGDVVGWCRRRTSRSSRSLSQREQRAEEPGRDARVARRPDEPASAFSTSSTITTQGAIASTSRSAWRTFASDWPTSEPSSVPTSRTSVGRPVSPPRALQNALLPEPGGPSRSTPRAPDPRGPAGPQGARAERLEGLQAAQVGEGLAAPVQGQQARLLEHPRLDLPEDLGGEPAVADQRQREGVLGLHPGQPGGGVEHGVQAVPLGQLARLGGDAAGDGRELVARRAGRARRRRRASPARRGPGPPGPG